MLCCAGEGEGEGEGEGGVRVRVRGWCILHSLACEAALLCGSPVCAGWLMTVWW